MLLDELKLADCRPVKAPAARLKLLEGVPDSEPYVKRG